MTPQCKLNESGRYAFVLESPVDKKVFVSYSKEPDMGLGKKLAPLLHKGVFDKKEGIDDKLCPGTEDILARAQKLNQQGKFWHYHPLPPDCIFNHTGKWIVIFEDQENNKVLRIVSEKEPIADLKRIEPIYYQQKTLI